MRCTRSSQRSVNRPPLRLAPVGDKTVELDYDGATYLPMPVSSCSKILMTNSVSLVRWRLSWQMRVMRVVSTLLQKTYSNNVSFKLPLAMKMQMPTPCATIPSSNSSSIGCETGAPLASQPTISRFENSVSRTEIYRMALVLMDQFIASYNSPPEVIVLDVDDTEDRAHGAQEQIRYDGYYGAIVSCHSTCMKASRGV